jgi:hypothetical protein
MFVLLAVALAIAWLAGVTVLHLAKAGVHLLLVLALLSLIVHVFRARRATGFH